MALENEYAARAGTLLFQDTDLISTVVYCDHYFGRCPDFIIDAARQRQGHLYLLPTIDVPWVADGIRDRGDRREEMHALFVARLASLGASTVEVSGDRRQRLQSAITAVDELLRLRGAS
jgi:nicotinamide riboside kinase